VGDRPCGTVDGAEIAALKARITPLIEEVIGECVTYKSASTDCNIPLSLGVPALCIGVCRYHGMHTREEWLDKASLLPGLEVSLRVAQELTK
jgi:di/tripeptidase